MGWVDADAHVVESPLTWDYLTPSEKKFRPKRRAGTRSSRAIKRCFRSAKKDANARVPVVVLAGRRGWSSFTPRCVPRRRAGQCVRIGPGDFPRFVFSRGLGAFGASRSPPRRRIGMNRVPTALHAMAMTQVYGRSGTVG